MLVYLVAPLLIAEIAASQALSGVAKSGSPVVRFMISRP